MELNILGFASSLSRKDERITKNTFPQGRRVTLPAFFSHYSWAPERESVNTHWSFVARVYPVVMANEVMFLCSNVRSTVMFLKNVYFSEILKIF